MRKFSTGSVTGLQIHNHREKESRTNPDIDKSKKSENKYLQKNKTYRNIINERIKKLGLKKAVRKDAVVMAEFIITSDSSFFEKLSKKDTVNFFKDSTNFMQKKYGGENLIDISLHFDETTPHMHISFVPVTADGRLSAKSIFTREHLRNLQTEIFENVGKKYGLSRGQEGSKAKHIETSKFKLDTLKQNYIDLQSAYNDTVKAVENLNPKSLVLLDATKLHHSVLEAAKVLDPENKKKFLDKYDEVNQRKLVRERERTRGLSR